MLRFSKFKFTAKNVEIIIWIRISEMDKAEIKNQNIMNITISIYNLSTKYGILIQLYTSN